MRSFVVRLVGVAALLAAALLTACGASERASSTAAPASGSIVEISGGERLGWSQAGGTPSRFAVYVDGGARVDVAATCASVADGSLSCESPLPPLTPGRHSLELVAWTGTDTERQESPRAAALIVQVTTATASHAAAAGVASSDAGAAIGVAGANGAATCGLAAAVGGEIWLWDSSGRISSVEARADRMRAIAWAPDREASDERWTVAALAPHPEFAKNGWTYVAQVSRDDDRLLRLVRYRQKGDVFGERAVLWQQTLPRPAGRLRLAAGPGNRLDLAQLSDPAVEERAAQPFLIRLTGDGRPAADNPGGGVYAAVTASRLADVAWTRDGGLPWIVERIGAGRYAIRRAGTASPAAVFASSAPIAAAHLIAGASQPTLWIATRSGTLLRFHDSVVGWVLSPARTDAASGREVRDAVPSAGIEMVFCGSQSGGPGVTTGGSGLWRRPLVD
jgi:Glucose / Sorbosone dehydrogenase